MPNYKRILKKIDTLFLDVDGVLNSGVLILGDDPEPLRTLNVKDGYALQLAVKKGFRIVIISGGRSEKVRNRFEKLGIKDIFLGVDYKYDVYQHFLKEKRITPHTVLYMGDDIPDYEIMKEVALAVCPADAAEEIKAVSQYISPYKGGEGCVRDVIEQLLKINDIWFDYEAFRW